MERTRRKIAFINQLENRLRKHFSLGGARGRKALYMLDKMRRDIILKYKKRPEVVPRYQKWIMSKYSQVITNELRFVIKQLVKEGRRRKAEELREGYESGGAGYDRRIHKLYIKMKLSDYAKGLRDRESALLEKKLSVWRRLLRRGKNYLPESEEADRKVALSVFSELGLDFYLVKDVDGLLVVHVFSDGNPLPPADKRTPDVVEVVEKNFGHYALNNPRFLFAYGRLLSEMDRIVMPALLLGHRRIFNHVAGFSNAEKASEGFIVGAVYGPMEGKHLGFMEYAEADYFMQSRGVVETLDGRLVVLPFYMLPREKTVTSDDTWPDRIAIESLKEFGFEWEMKGLKGFFNFVKENYLHDSYSPSGKKLKNFIHCKYLFD